MTDPNVHEVARLLGGKRILGTQVESRADLVTAIEEGLPYASLESVAKKVGLTTLEEKSQVLGIPERTLQRRAEKGRLDRFESDATVRLARIAQRTEEVLEDMGKAYRWLREPNAALGGKKPLELIRTELGARMVEDVLNRIEYSVYT